MEQAGRPLVGLCEWTYPLSMFLVRSCVPKDSKHVPLCPSIYVLASTYGFRGAYMNDGPSL